MELTSKNVEKIFLDCLFRDDENTDKHIRAEGITTTVGFHPERIETHKSDVESMLACLPDEFQSKKSGGWSFLNACNDKAGRQWGEHKNMEQLFQLGVALGLAKWLMPREMWAMCPGGMPYVSVLQN